MNVARYVFISYSGEDQAIGGQVCRLLEEQGIPCWMAPRNIEPGRDYGEQIIDAIESSRVMVLVLSEHANTSIFVKNEVERAISKGKVVIPLRIQNVQPSRALELFVSRSQWVDAWAPPMESRVAVLGAAIRGLLGLPPLEETAANSVPPYPAFAGQMPPPPGATRAAPAGPLGRMPRAVLIGGVICLAVLIAVGGLYMATGSGSRSTETRQASSQGLRTAALHTAGPGMTYAQESSPAVSTPQVTISADNAAQIKQLGLWDASQGLSQVMWSADGKTLAVGTGRGLTLLDPSTLTALSTIGASSSRAIAASADWKVIAIAGDNGVQLWSVDGSQLTDTLAGSKETSNLVVSPDGRNLVTQTGSAVKLWDTATGKELQTLVSGDNPFGYGLAFSPDGKVLAGTDGSGVKEWDTSTWKPIAVPSCMYEPNAMAFSPDGKTIAVAGAGGSGGESVVNLCGVSTGLQIRSIKSHAQSIAFSPDGTMLVVASSSVETVQLLAVASGSELAALDGHVSQIMSVAFSPDGKLIASAAGDGLRLWGVPSASASASAAPPASPIAAISMPSIPRSPSAITTSSAPGLKQSGIWDKGRVYKISYSPDGKSIAAVTDQNVSILDSETLAVKDEIETGGGGYGVLAIARDWSMMAVAGSNGVTLWGMGGAQLKIMPVSEYSMCGAISPDDRLLATCIGDAVKIWDIASGTEAHTIPGSLGQYDSVAFTPDGKTLIAAGSKVEFWDVSTWKPRQTQQDYSAGMGTIAVSPDGTQVATTGGDLNIASVATGLKQRTLTCPGVNQSLAYSPDGGLIAAASWDNKVRIFDVSGGRLVKTIEVHSDRAEAVAFSPDGATLATGGLDSTLRLWRAGP